MNNAVIPEIIIYHYLKMFQKLLKESIEFSSNDSIIEEVFQGVEKIGRYNPIEESRRIFSKDESFFIKFGLNINSAELPAVHIVLPDEQIDWEGIGWNTDYERNEDSTITESKEVFFRTDYNLIILDKNADNVVFMYHVLRYMFLSFHVNLELDGFETMKIGGRDLVQQPGIIPIDIYSRNLTISFKYSREFKALKQIEKTGSSMKVRMEQVDIAGNEKDLDVDEELDEEL